MHAKAQSSFCLKMDGALDDDLFVIRATPSDCVLLDAYQMHNSSGVFLYHGHSYKIEHCPGFINYTRNFLFSDNDNELYVVALANERDDARLNTRVRTHYKNDQVLLNGNIFLPALLPEKNSVPNYPTWFGESDIPLNPAYNKDGSLYNYYHLFDNTTIQIGIIVKDTNKPIEVLLFDNDGALVYTYSHITTNSAVRIKADQTKTLHPFEEIGGIINKSLKNTIINERYIGSMVVRYDNRAYNIVLPYPMMYPNLLFVSAVTNNLT